MNRFVKLFAIAGFVALAGCGAMPNANIVKLGGTLAGSSEVPPKEGAGAGTVEASFNKETSMLSWKVVYTGLSGPAGAGHFHGPAAAGQNAGVVLGFKGSVESPITGEAALTPAQAADVLAGKWYVNIHTKANPGGEIRAQVMPAM
jgi:hypothetical protein